VVTVLFADISGFTSMSESLDPEEVTDIMNRVFDRLTEVLTRHGGTIDKYIGDCIMALFGAPRSHGDDAERAARAGLEMQRTVVELADELEEHAGVRLQMRVGLNTGFVIAGQVGGAGHRDYTVMGDTVNLANRMESAATKGRVLVSANTHRFVAERFVCEDAGALRVKGKAEPVRAYHVVRERRARLEDAPFVFEGVPIPFVGRRDLMASLHATMRRVRPAQQAQAVVLRGPSGAGKSRLVAEFWREVLLEAPGALLVSGRATKHGGGDLLVPLRRGLQGLVADGDRALEDSVADLLAAGLGPGGAATLDETARAGLRLVLDLLAGRDVLRGSAEEAGGARRTLFWALATLLAGLSREGPLVVSIADAHLADDTLLDFVTYLLGEQAPGAPVLVLWEVQDSPHAPAAAATLEGLDERVERLAVGSLRPGELSEMLDELLAPCGLVPRWIPEWIVPRSEGNPLYALEQVRSLRTLGSLRIDDDTGAWEITAKPPVGAALPETLHAAFQATLDSRPPIERAVLQRAAVVGRVFWDAVVADLCGEVAGVREVEQALRSLCSQGLLHRRSRSSLEGAGELRFKSELFRRACAESLLHKEQRSLHREAARALEARGGGTTHALVVASHLEESGEPGRALGLLLDVAELELQALSLEDAREHLDHAGRLLAGLVDEEDAPAGPAVRHHLLSAEVLRTTGDLAEADTHVGSGLARLAEARAGDEPQEPGLAVSGAGLHEVRGRILRSRGDHEGSVEAFSRALEHLPDAVRHRAARVRLQALLAWDLDRAGRADEARELVDSVLRELPGEDFDDEELASAVASVHDAVAARLLRDGELQAALTHYLAARRLREIGGNPARLAHSDGNIAAARAVAGDWADAAEAFARVLRVWSTLGDREMTAIARINLAECLQHLDRREEAEEQLVEAERMAGRLKTGPLMAEIERLRGE